MNHKKGKNGEEVIVMPGEIRQKMLPKYIEVRGARVHNLKNIVTV